MREVDITEKIIPQIKQLLLQSWNGYWKHPVFSTKLYWELRNSPLRIVQSKAQWLRGSSDQGGAGCGFCPSVSPEGALNVGTVTKQPVNWWGEKIWTGEKQKKLKSQVFLTMKTVHECLTMLCLPLKARVSGLG